MSRDDIWTAILLALGPPPDPRNFWTAGPKDSWWEAHHDYVNRLIVQIAMYQPRALTKKKLQVSHYLAWCEEIRNGDQA